MTPEGREFTQSLKLAAIALVCAVLTATLVIGAGEALLRRSQTPTGSDATPILVQTTG